LGTKKLYSQHISKGSHKLLADPMRRFGGGVDALIKYIYK